MGQKGERDCGFRIADLKARYWILAPDSSEFGGLFFFTTKAPSHQN
jgi:hypothetical protein